MKKLFLLSLAVIISITAYADSKQMAVLNHNGEYTTFYGADALSNAANAAQENDIITLSPGYYSYLNKTNKFIKIIGSGIEGDYNQITRVQSVEIRTDPYQFDAHGCVLSIENLIVEGDLRVDTPITLNLKKCKIGNLCGYPEKANITNCELNRMGVYHEWKAEYTNMINSVIVNEMGSFEDRFEYNFSNCVFNCKASFRRGTFENCIFMSGNAINSECSTTNCKYAGGDKLDFFKYHSSDNECAPLYAQVFTEDGFYELTPEYAQKWLGKDGTQVGIYGGPAPFTTVPSNPYISKFDVAPKTTPEGKLSIDVEISAAAK